MTWTQASFCRELFIMSSVWSLDTCFNQSPIYHLYVLKVKISYTKQDFVFKYHILHKFIYYASGIFKSWEFYRSCLSARKQQGIHIVSFPAGHKTISHVHSTVSIEIRFLTLVTMYKVHGMCSKEFTSSVQTSKCMPGSHHAKLLLCMGNAWWQAGVQLIMWTYLDYF